MKRIIAVIIILIGFSVLAQDFDKAKMDDLFTVIEANQKGMGSISIFQNGLEVYQNAFGYASIEAGIKANSKTKYRIGSISKTFTATIIMQLIQEGKLDLSTKLSQFYPKVENAEDISIELLLKHRTGIFNFTNLPNYQLWMEEPIAKEDLLSKIIESTSLFEPDQRTEYSNSNYILLSLIAESIENSDFAEILKTRITEPCSLANTYYGSNISIDNNEALSYVKLTDWQPSTETDMSIPMGAGAIVANPTDLNTFLNCIFEYKLLTKDSVDAMTEIQDGIGLGMFQVPFYEKRAFGHGGGIDGFQSNAFYFPNEKTSVTYLSNGVVMPMNDILIGILSIYFGRDYDLPEFGASLQLKTEDLDKYLGVYSSPTFPLKMYITKEANTLIAQATDQPSFPLEAYELHKFKFDQAGLKMEFVPDEGKMIFWQSGGRFELKRE